MTPDECVRYLLAIEVPPAGLRDSAFRQRLKLEILECLKTTTRDALGVASLSYEPAPLRNLLQDMINLPQYVEV